MIPRGGKADVSVYLEKSNEVFDGALNQATQFPQGWEYKSSFKDFNISKSYIEGRLDVLVFFCIAGELQEYVALFRNRQRAYERDTDCLFFGGRIISVESGTQQTSNFRVTDAIVYGPNTLGLGKDEVVLIGDIHPMKTPESVISSEIWLMPVDESLIGDAHALYLSRSISYVLGSTLANRKISVGCNCSPVVSDERRSQVIECRPEIVNDITNHQTKSRINLGDILNYVLGVARMRIVLSSEFARVYFEKGSSPYLKVTDVVVGPIDF
jgi:hypothetical protein